MMLWSLLQGEGLHDLWAGGFHTSTSDRWCGRTLREVTRSPGRQSVSVGSAGPHGASYIITDGPVSEGCFKFSVTLLGPLDVPRAARPADLDDIFVEFRVGMLGWPFASCPQVPARAFEADRAVTCRLRRDDFRAGVASFALRRDLDGRLDLSLGSGGPSIGVGSRPLEISSTGAYGAYIWHQHGRSVEYAMLSKGPDSLMARAPSNAQSPCPHDYLGEPEARCGQFFRTKPALSRIRCKAYTAPPFRGRYASTLPPDVVFGPVQEVVSQHGYVAVNVDGLWINVWKHGTYFATPLATFV